MPTDDFTMPLFADDAALVQEKKNAPAGGKQSLAHIVATSQEPLTKDQKTFNSLLRKIESKRALLAEWNAAIPAFRLRYAKDLLPLQERETDCQLELVRALDEAYDRKGTTKTEKKKLGVIIFDFVGQILARREDETCKALYAKYGESDYDEDSAGEEESMRAMLESVFGMDLEGVDLSSPDEFLQHAAEKLQAEEDARQAKRATRKKTAKQLEREAKAAEEEKLVSQSIREAYRKLASALHPDRETDPDEKRRKTELMQLANEAYEKGSLLDLLELQLRLEHIDSAHLAEIEPLKLKRYIKVLKEQFEELEMELDVVVSTFASAFNQSPFDLPAPDKLVASIDGDIRSYEAAFPELQELLADAREPQRLKAWLKTVRLQRQPAPVFGYPF